MSALSQLPQFDSRSSPAPQNAGLDDTSSRAATAQPVLLAYYNALFAAHGSQHWWPGRTPFEVIVGAILTQNTSWTNVEPCIKSLRREKLLTPRAIETVSAARLARLIRSSGYFRQKAKKLKAFVHFLRTHYQGSLAKMFRAPTPTLRKQLLAIHGVGPETADAILLYAGNHPVFVVDAYTPASSNATNLRKLAEATSTSASFSRAHSLPTPRCIMNSTLLSFIPASTTAARAIRVATSAR